MGEGKFRVSSAELLGGCEFLAHGLAKSRRAASHDDALVTKVTHSEETHGW